MTKKQPGSKFVKVELSAELKAEFARVCDWYNMSEAATIRLICQEWCDEWQSRHGEIQAGAEGG